MEIFFHEQNGVIVRRFSGKVQLEDIIVAWNSLFASYPDLKNYKGIAIVILDATFEHKAENIQIIQEYIKDHLDHVNDLKIAFVMDSPLVTSIMILAQHFKSLQISPFTTEKAAMEWILI